MSIESTLQPCNLANYARKKNLPVDFLEVLGFSNISYQLKPAVKISYQDTSGNEIAEIAVNFRVNLGKKTGSAVGVSA